MFFIILGGLRPLGHLACGAAAGRRRVHAIQFMAALQMLRVMTDRLCVLTPQQPIGHHHTQARRTMKLTPQEPPSMRLG